MLWLTEYVDAVLLAGLVLETAAGDASTLHQHLSGHHVLQAPHVVTTVIVFIGLCWLGIVKVGSHPPILSYTSPNQQNHLTMWRPSKDKYHDAAQRIFLHELRSSVHFCPSSSSPSRNEA